MMGKMKMKNILYRFIFIFLTSVSLFSCTFWDINEKNERTYTVTGKIISEINGTVPETLLQKNTQSLQSRTAAVSIPQNISFEITAKQIDPMNDTSIDTEVKVSASTNEFTIKLTEGVWQLSADMKQNENTIMSTPENCETKITIGEGNSIDSPSFVNDISISVKPFANNNGKVKLLIKKDTDKIKSFKAVWSVPNEENPNSLINKIEKADFTGNEVYFYLNEEHSEDVTVKSGSYKVDFYFYDKETSDENYSTLFEIYKCEEVINVFDSLTTDTWLLNDSRVSSLYLAKTDSDSETADFNVSETCLNKYNKTVYEVTSDASFHDAVSNIKNLVESSDDVLNFKIILLNDIKFENAQTYFTVSGSNTCLIPGFNKKANLIICGNNGLKTIDANTKTYGFYITQNNNITLQDICIKGTTSGAVYCDKNNPILKGKIILNEPGSGITTSSYTTLKIKFAGPLSLDSEIIVPYETGAFTSELKNTALITDKSDVAKIFKTSNDEYLATLIDPGEACFVKNNDGTISTKFSDDIYFKTECEDFCFDSINKKFLLYKGYADSESPGDLSKAKVYVKVFKGETDITNEVKDNFTLTVDKRDGNASITDEGGVDGTLTSRLLYFRKSAGVPGIYTLTASAVYEGKKYSSSWQVEFFDIELVPEITSVSPGSSGIIPFKTICISDSRKDITNKVTLDSVTCSKITGYEEDSENSGSYNIKTESSSASISGNTIKIDTSQECAYKIDVKISYNGIEILRSAFINVCNGVPYYVLTKGTDNSGDGTIDSPFTNLPYAIEKITLINDEASNYKIFLLNNAVAQLGHCESIAMEEWPMGSPEYIMYGYTFLRINAAESNKLLKLTITSYNTEKTFTIDTRNVPLNETWPPTPNIRILFAGQYSDVTLNNVQLLGGTYKEEAMGNDYKGVAAYISKNAKLTLENNTIIGSESIDSDYLEDKIKAANYVNNASGSIIEAVAGSTLVMNNCHFSENYTENSSRGINISSNANLTVCNVECKSNFGNIFYIEKTSDYGSKIFTLDNVEIDDLCTDSSAIYVTNSISAESNTCKLVLNNVSIGVTKVKPLAETEVYGAFLYVSNADVELNNCVVDNFVVETQKIYGSAIYFTNEGGNAVLTNTYIYDGNGNDYPIYLQSSGSNKTVLNLCNCNNITGKIYLNDSKCLVYVNPSTKIPTGDDGYALWNVGSGFLETKYTLSLADSITNGTQILNGQLSVIKNKNNLFDVDDTSKTIDEQGKLSEN